MYQFCFENAGLCFTKWTTLVHKTQPQLTLIRISAFQAKSIECDRRHVGGSPRTTKKQRGVHHPGARAAHSNLDRSAYPTQSRRRQRCCTNKHCRLEMLCLSHHAIGHGHFHNKVVLCNWKSYFGFADVAPSQQNAAPVATPSPVNPPATSLIQLQGPTAQQLVSRHALRTSAASRCVGLSFIGTPLPVKCTALDEQICLPTPPLQL